MPFIGNQPADKFLTLEKQVFTTSATDTYTLDREVSSVNDIELFLNNVRQEPTEAYTISGTTLTLASAITASDSMYCVYQGRAVGTQSPAVGSVTGDMMSYPLTNFSSTGIDDNATSTAITIDSSERVGIGTSSPSRIFQISAVDSQISALSSTSSGSSAVHFGDSDDDNVGQVNYQHSDNSMRFTVNASEAMRIDSSGRVMIGTTSQDGQLTVNYQSPNNGAKFTLTNSSSASNVLVFNNTNGTVGYIQTSGTSTSYNTSSDYRLKENVIDLADATTRVKQLQPKRFNFIADANTTVDGFLAHEVSSIVPEAITGTHNEVQVWKEGEELPEGVSVGDNKLDDEGNTIPKYQGIDQSKLVPLLTASLKEAIAKIEELETRIATLEGN